MIDTRNLLIEIGTEELPPKALKSLSDAFVDGLRVGLDKAQLTYQAIRPYATPRRLAALIEVLAIAQPDRESLKRGPALAAAYNAEGQPTPAVQGFARSCGVDIGMLETLTTEQGQWLSYRSRERGQPTVTLIPDIVRGSLDRLPIPKRMRWGSGTEEFVRPVHWVVLLFGGEKVEGEVLGVLAGNQTHGHRFHHPGAIELAHADDYAETLEREGHVIADFKKRRALIRTRVTAAAESLGGQAEIDPALLDEVTALVEWPSLITGDFDPRFLAIPSEILIATMKDQQRYFHVVDGAGRLLPHFITVANIDSRQPETVKRGNERVVTPRLTDAAFFWDQDRRTRLAERREQLREVVFQKQLGSVYEKTERTAALAEHISAAIGGDPALARRAAVLAKCDLLSNAVGEFPELQGVMGCYYARHDGEPAEVAQAITEHYLPRYAGDRLPATKTGIALASADRLDTLVGIFGIGQPPTGDKDPFALRRAALGVLRIIIECELDLDLHDLLRVASTQYGERFTQTAVADQVLDFMLDRLRAYFVDLEIPLDVFEAVLARRPTQPADFRRRVVAVKAFRQLPESESLAAANKRIANILKQAANGDAEVKRDLLRESAEQELARALSALRDDVTAKLRARDYTEALRQLAGLRDSVDRFFDQVMVMAEDPALRANRVALLRQLQALFMAIADISKLHA